MKIVLKKLLSNRLTEIEVKNKPMFGSGDNHKVYRFNKYPNRLFKIGDEFVVDEWLDLFKSYPQYFPKIYRTFEYKPNPELTVVEIENLDTQTASVDFKKLNGFIEDHFDKLSYKNQLITIDNFFEEEQFDIIINAVKKEQPELLDLFYKFEKVLSALSPVVKKDLGRPIDLHFGNVGYDTNKNLKLIDV